MHKTDIDSKFVVALQEFLGAVQRVDEEERIRRLLRSWKWILRIG